MTRSKCVKSLPSGCVFSPENDGENGGANCKVLRESIPCSVTTFEIDIPGRHLKIERWKPRSGKILGSEKVTLTATTSCLLHWSLSVSWVVSLLVG